MPESENNIPVPRLPLVLLLTAAFFVAPLLFFTGLTRNPYYLQITILNIAVLGAAALFLRASLKAGAWRLPMTPLARPLAALAAGAHYLLLDNFDLDALTLAVRETHGRAKVEASGGVTLATIRAVAETGVDFISVGGLTKHLQALDLSLRFVRS